MLFCLIKIIKSLKNSKLETDIHDTHKANKSILITSLIPETPAKIDDLLRLEAKKAHKRKFDTSILHELREEKDEKDEKEKNLKNSICSKKPNNLAKSASFEPPITSSLRYSVREYINKTRDVVLLRHSIEIKKETALKFEENYSNQIESVSESIASLKQTKELFENDFIIKFDKYIKYLRLQREKEINEINAILDFKSQLELEIQKLETRKFKTKAKLILFREYRDFLICVRESTICLPVFFIENENYKNNIINIFDFNKTRNSKNSKLLNDSKILNFKNNKFAKEIGEGNYSDLDSEMEEDERNKIIVEREKLQKMRNQLLNQLQANSPSNNDTLTNSNKNTKLNRNSKQNNFNFSSVNIKESFNTRENSNNNTNEDNSIAPNSPKKQNNNNNKQIRSSQTKHSTIIAQNAIWINNSKSQMNLNHLNLNSNYNFTDNSQNATKFRNNTNNKEPLDPTLIGVDLALIEKFNNYISKPIYETTEELNEDIKKLQLENINLLKKLTSASAKANLMKQQLQKINKEDKGEVAVLQLDIDQRERKKKKKKKKKKK